MKSLRTCLELTPYQLNFYGVKGELPRDDDGRLKSPRLLEKYDAGWHRPSQKTLDRFRGSKGEKAERWLNNSLWLLISENAPPNTVMLQTLRDFRPTTEFRNGDLKSVQAILNKICKHHAPDYLWRTGSLEALKVLFVIVHLSKRGKKDFIYVQAVSAALHLSVLLTREEPLACIKQELMDHLHETFFAQTPTFKKSIYNRMPNIQVLHDSIDRAIAILLNAGVSINSRRELATAYYRLWRAYLVDHGFASLYLRDDNERKQFIKQYYGRRQGDRYANFRPANEHLLMHYRLIKQRMKRSKKVMPNDIDEASIVQLYIFLTVIR